ncbi:MAG TPA: mandelate racemase/muconate lactonizing enzyme family protein, partial [Devosia sp.]|nr:mandelate racemase/muconate lactonizing enzyme family protein [Devosia sp.]
MKITRIVQLHADFGWRTISFLKIETDEGLVGWSEYYEGAGNTGLTAVLASMAETLIGRDPCRIDRILTDMHARTIQAVGGINQQAIAALGNGLLDIKAKALNVPVHALLGGAIRDRVPVYWSHCASYRGRYAKHLGIEKPRSYDDIARIGEEAGQRGFKMLKTNTLMVEQGEFRGHRPTAGEGAGYPELNLSPDFIAATIAQLTALREGAGPGVGICLDVNFYFKPAAILQLARLLEPFELDWLEVDNFDAGNLAAVRAATRTPIASCEHQYERRGYRPFLEARALDVAIVDPIWNGYLEAMKIAQLCEAYELNIAPHNYYGYLSDFISANLAAVVPNLRVMEIDVDGVPWRPEFYSHAPEIT